MATAITYPWLAFRRLSPQDKIIELRSYVRQRATLIQNAAMYTQRMQKALTQMNLYLHNVLSSITGVTGLAILTAILSGETDPDKLSE